MDKGTLSVTAVDGVIITGRVLRSTRMQHARIKRIPFVRPGWATVRPKPGKLTTKWPIEKLKENQTFLDTNKPNTEDIDNVTVSPSTNSRDCRDMSSSTAVVTLPKYMHSHIDNDHCDLIEDESFLVESGTIDAHDEPESLLVLAMVSCLVTAQLASRTF